jgi:hypothetical protein
MTFEIQNTSAPIPFQAYVYRWDTVNNGLTGPAVFSSVPMTVGTAPGFQAVTVNTGGVALTPGDEYVAFFSTIGDGGPNNGSAAWGLVSNDATYPNGTFEFNNATTFPGLFVPVNPAWNSVGGGPPNNFGDLAFSLSFTTGPAAIPEPPSFVLGGMIAAAFGLRTLLRRRNRPTSA